MESGIVQTIHTESGELMEVCYEILIDDIKGDDGQLIGEIMGVKVKTPCEEESVRYITTDHAEMERILLILTKGQVTPVTLRDVLSDILA